MMAIGKDIKKTVLDIRESLKLHALDIDESDFLFISETRTINRIFRRSPSRRYVDVLFHIRWTERQRFETLPKS